MEKQKNISLLSISEKIIGQQQLSAEEISSFNKLDTDSRLLLRDLILSNLEVSNEEQKVFYKNLCKDLGLKFIVTYLKITGENKEEEIEKILSDKSLLSKDKEENQIIINTLVRMVIFEGNVEKIKRTLDYVQSL